MEVWLSSRHSQPSTERLCGFTNRFGTADEQMWTLDPLESTASSCAPNRATIASPLTPANGSHCSNDRIHSIPRSFEQSTTGLVDYCLVPNTPTNYLDGVRTTVNADHMTAQPSWNAEFSSASPCSKSIAGVSTPNDASSCEGVIQGEPDNYQVCSGPIFKLGSIGNQEYSLENASPLRGRSCSPESRTYLNGDADPASLFHANLPHSQRLNSPFAYHQASVDADQNRCPNITISPWGWTNLWRGSNTAIPSSHQHDAVIDSSREQGHKIRQVADSSRTLYSTPRAANSRPWSIEDPDYTQSSNLPNDPTTAQAHSNRHAFYPATGQQVKHHDPSIVPMAKGLRHQDHNCPMYCSEDHPDRSTPSAYLQQLAFSPNDTWYHSLGLLSAFTQILAPSHCSQTGRENNLNHVESEKTPLMFEDPTPCIDSPAPGLEGHTYRPTVPTLVDGHRWTGSITSNPSPCYPDPNESAQSSDLRLEMNHPHSESFGDISDSMLDDLKHFACRFKQRRMKLGITQAEVGRALGRMQLGQFGCLSQSTICRFESLTLSHNNMLVLKPILEKWLEQMEIRARASPGSSDHDLSTDPNGHSTDCGPEAERRRRRTSITEPEKRMLEAYFQVEPKPTSEELGRIASGIRLRKSVVRVWFCNQRQKQKRMQMKQHLSRGSQMCLPSVTDPSMQCYTE